MKATILVRDLFKLIAKHGDLDVFIAMNDPQGVEVNSKVKCVDELTQKRDGLDAFEIYGED